MYYYMHGPIVKFIILFYIIFYGTIFLNYFKIRDSWANRSFALFINWFLWHSRANCLFVFLKLFLWHCCATIEQANILEEALTVTICHSNFLSSSCSFNAKCTCSAALISQSIITLNIILLASEIGKYFFCYSYWPVNCLKQLFVHSGSINWNKLFLLLL